MTGSVRFCFKCMLIKPDRAHHCSVCGTCVLKVRTFLPFFIFTTLKSIFFNTDGPSLPLGKFFYNLMTKIGCNSMQLNFEIFYVKFNLGSLQVNNCVNFSNYKFFILFLGYALIYCLYISLSSLRYFILFWEVN